MTLTQDEIFQKVKVIVADCLGSDEEEVVGTAVLKDDLGAESLDFLDISFRLEKAFGIKITKGEMMPEGLTNDPNFAQDDRVTPAGVLELKKRMPFADFTEFEKDPTVDHISKLFTVNTIVHFVEGKLK
jgi:acyl carrier protein